MKDYKRVEEMKRIVTLSMTIVLIIVFSSCGTDQRLIWPAKTIKTENKSEAVTGSTLTIVYPMFRSIPKDMELVQNEINKLVRKKINVSIKLVGLGLVNYEQECRLMLASREKIDLILTGSIGNFGYSREVASGQLMDMNALISQYGQGIKSLLGEFLNSGKIGGKVFGVPTLRDEAKCAGFTIRKDLVDKYRIDLSKIKSLQDLEPVFELLKRKEPRLAPFFPGQESLSGIDYAMRVPGGDPLDNDYFFSGVMLDAKGKLRAVDYFETPEYKSMIQLMRKWNRKGYLLPNIALNDDAAYALIREGRIASYMQDMKPGIEGQISRQCARDMVVVPISPAICNTSTVAGFMWGIPSYAKMPQKSMEFLNMMYSDKHLVNLLDWGIEGKHYVKLADGTIDYPQGVNASNTGYGTNEGFVFGNQMLSYVWKGDPINLWKQMEDFNKTSIKSKALGFVFDTSPVETEFAACTGVWQEYQKVLGVGAVNPDKVLPEFIAKLKTAGVDRIVAEKQRQLNEWAKLNHVK